MNTEKIIEIFCKKYDVPGMIVAVEEDNRTQLYPYGYANRKKKIKVDENTLFEIASLSKAFTALAVLLLEQQQMLSLDNKITEYISGLKLCMEGDSRNLADSITLKHLLYHTSGLIYQTIEISAFAQSELISELIQRLNYYPLMFKPGEKHLYTSMNYDLLAYVVEVVTEMNYADFLERHIFHDLGLKHTYAWREKAIATGKMSEGYKFLFGRNSKCKCFEHRANLASGYIISNIQDLMLWSKIQVGLIKDIPEKYKIAIERSHIPDKTVDDHLNFYYGGGWNIHIRESRIMHMGNNPAFASCIVLRPKKNHITCVLMNTNSLATAELAEDIYKDKSRTNVKSYTTGMNYMLDRVGSAICIMNGVLLSMMVLVTPWNIIWEILYALLSITLIAEFIYIKIKKKVRTKVTLEWVTNSVMWSYLSYFALSIISILIYIYYK